MDYTSTLINQIILMFIIIGIGFYLMKTKFYNENFVSTLGNLLVFVINPLTIFNSFVNDYSNEKVNQLLISFLLAIIAMVITVVISYIAFHDKKYYVEQYCTMIANCGFFGLPIIIAIFGQKAVFFGSSVIALNNIAQWAYGPYIMTRDIKTINFKKIITNPNIIAFLLGLVFFFIRIPVPIVLTNTFKSMGDMMGPISSLIIGSSLANTNIGELKNDVKTLIPLSILRLAIIPLCIVFAFKFVDNSYSIIKYTILIMCSTPSGTTGAVLTRIFNRDYEKASRIICFTTILSAISLPLITELATKIW